MLFIKIVHITFLIILIAIPAFTVYYLFCKETLEDAKIEDDTDHPIDFVQLRLKENYDRLNAKARKGMN